MWKSLIRCAVIGGIIVFLWTMLSWMVLPIHKTMINRFTEPSEVVSTLTRYAPNDGIYVLPSMDQTEEKKAGSPFIFINIKRDVDFSSMTRPIIQGLIMQMLGAFFITYVLLKTKALRYWGRVVFVTVIGLIVAILGVLPACNWWHFPIAWTLLEFFDIIIGWFLGGLVIAKLIKN